jgi:hypothetical protein
VCDDEDSSCASTPPTIASPVQFIPDATRFQAGGGPKQALTYVDVGGTPFANPGRQSAVHVCPGCIAPLGTLHPLADVYAELSGGRNRASTLQ